MNEFFLRLFFKWTLLFNQWDDLFKSYDDFIERCNPSESTLQALVFSGALDIFGKTKKSMIENSSKQNAIFLKHMKNVIVDDSEYDFSYLSEMEKKYLGMNIEYNIYRNIKNLYQKYKAINITSLKPLERKYIIASFTDIKEITTKKKELMMLGSISDEFNTIRFTIFPQAYKDIDKKDIIYNKLYLLFGSLEKDNKEEYSFIISSIKSIE